MKKYQFMIMMIVCGVQVYGASEGIAPRTRTSSKEAMEKIRKEEDQRTTSPRFQLAALIYNFQNKSIRPLLGPISCSRDPRTQRKYDALCGFAANLTRYKNILEIVDVSCAMEEFLRENAQSVYNSLDLYVSSDIKIDQVAQSAEFLALQKKCEEFMA